MKYNGPKVKLSRKIGVPLTPKASKYMERKPYGPGDHGPKQRYGRSSPSDYKRQLMEKQRLRYQYNIHERQMLNYYKKAVKQKGNTADNLVQLLESRLDALVLRGGLARSIYAARQYVSHKHITVNDKRVNIPSYQVKPGDVISVREKSRQMISFAEALDTAPATPAYLDTNKDQMTIKYLRLPEREEIPIICETSLVIEFYSR
jgi:small subunit ribosomal protein S4